MSSTEVAQFVPVSKSSTREPEIGAAARRVDAGSAPDKSASPRPSPDYSAEHDEVGAPPPTPRTRLSALLLVGLLAAAAGWGAYEVGWKPRAKRTQELVRAVGEVKAALPRVRVVAPRAMPATDSVLLPGDVRAWEESSVYPRANGYLNRRLVDLGDHVKAGALLAVIDSPEIDAQVEQAAATLAESEAALESAVATENLNETSVGRLRQLIHSNSIPQQDLDEAEASLLVAKARTSLARATINVNKANLRRATDLQSFSSIYAPFDGIVTQRSVDQGQLVTAGNGATQALFRIAKTDLLRVFVDVPQAYAANVSRGLTATLVIRNMPGRTFTGTITRTAGAIDLATRTMLTEIRVPNEDGSLLPGSYVQVSMELKREDPPLLIPASALATNSEGTRVAVVDSERRVRFRDVEVDRDYGREIGIGSGLAPADLVVANPGDRLAEGIVVEIDGSSEDAAR